MALLWLGGKFWSFTAQVVQNRATGLYLFLGGGNTEIKKPLKSPLITLEGTRMTQEGKQIR